MEAQPINPGSLISFSEENGFDNPFDHETMAAYSRRLDSYRQELSRQFEDSSVEELHRLGAERLSARINIGRTALSV